MKIYVGYVDLEEIPVAVCMANNKTKVEQEMETYLDDKWIQEFDFDGNLLTLDEKMLKQRKDCIKC